MKGDLEIYHFGKGKEAGEGGPKQPTHPGARVVAS